jgi:hypothetical protein
MWTDLNLNFVCKNFLTVDVLDDPFIMETRNGSLTMLLPQETDDVSVARSLNKLPFSQ